MKNGISDLRKEDTDYLVVWQEWGDYLHHVKGFPTYHLAKEYEQKVREDYFKEYKEEPHKLVPFETRIVKTVNYI